MQARLMAIILLSNERKETWSTQCLTTLEKIKFFILKPLEANVAINLPN